MSERTKQLDLPFNPISVRSRNQRKLMLIRAEAFRQMKFDFEHKIPQKESISTTLWAKLTKRVERGA